MHKREAYRLIILEPAKSRIARGECPTCGKPKTEWRRTIKYTCCSPACTQKFWTKYYVYGWPDLRRKVFKRDNYTCQKCKKRFIVRDIKTKKEFGNDSQFIADHIVPIALGGDQWDIDNVQTLCIQCNKVKTKEDQGKIAKQRKIERVLCKGQRLLSD